MAMEVVIIEHQQGSAEWHAHRDSHFNSSEAAAMLGQDPNMSRSELLRMKATGSDKEFSEWVQKNILDKGHEYEAMARPIAEKIVGEDLYPVVLAVKPGTFGLPLSASLDGLTMANDKAWEHKRLNKELVASIEAQEVPDSKWPQLEQALLLSGAEGIVFMASDGEESTERHLWYVSVPERRAKLLAGWKLFAEDLSNYQHVEVKADVVGKAIEALPVPFVQVEGRVVASNMGDFKAAARQFIDRLPKDLKTDQDFADADKAIKACEAAEAKLKAVKAAAQAQAVTIDEVFRAIDDVGEEVRQARLGMTRQVEAEKTNRRAEIMQKGKDELAAHVAKLNERIGGNWMPAINADFAGAMKSKKTIASLQEAVNTALLHAKLDADKIANTIEANRKEVGGCMHLFPDFAQVCTKPAEDFANLIAARVAKENERIEAERERIRQEEAAKLAAEAAKAEQPAAQSNIPPRGEAGTTPAGARPEPAAPVVTQAANESNVSPIAQADNGKKMKLGEINAALGFAVSAEFLAKLGFEAITERNAKLYRECDFRAICAAIKSHVDSVAESGVWRAAA